jgi:hypothetical protein
VSSQQVFGPEARRVFRPLHPPGTGLHRLWWFLRFAATIPLTSRAGARRLLRDTQGDAPTIWRSDFAGKRALIIGTGPSLDRVDDAFFNRFDTLVYINFAVRRARFDRPEYFFTTDLGPTREYLDRFGSEAFRRLGPQRCVVAPYFMDLWHQLTPEGRTMFTPLRPDATHWVAERMRSLPLPIIRNHPRYPDWDTYTLPNGGRAVPVLPATSALTAILFAALNGSRDISLIGCDFSDGRAASVSDGQTTNVVGGFNAARAELAALSANLARQDVVVTNHSWLV